MMYRSGLRGQASLLDSVLDGECVPKAAVDLDSHCQVSVCNL